MWNLLFPLSCHSLPALEVNLIPTKVEIFVRENLSHLLKKCFQEGVDPFLSWIEGTHEAVLFSPVIVALCQQARLSWLKGLGVSRRVKLTDHPDSSHSGVFYNLSHVLLGVDSNCFMPSPLLAEIVKFIAKTLVVIP